MKKGFTLIEMLIVMAIIGALSTLAIGGYMDFRRNSLLDLSADNIVSQLENLRTRAKFGDIGSAKFDEISERINGNEVKSVNESISCFGFYFKRGDNGEHKLQAYSLPFLNLKKYDVISETFKYSGCDEFSKRSEFDLNVENDIVFESDDMPLDNLFLRFAPPSGESEVSVDGGLKYAENGLSFLIKYGEDMRKIRFDSLTEKFKIER
jgi:prepilin-type N-terminal cleavage/methylation domain-containing protein